MSVQCILNVREKSSLFTCHERLSSKLVKKARPRPSVRKDVRHEGPRLRITRAIHLTRQALCTEWRTCFRLSRGIRNDNRSPDKRALGTPGVDWRVRRGRPQWWHTRRAVPASRRRSQPPPYTRASHPFP